MKNEPTEVPKFNPLSNIWILLILMILGFQLANYFWAQGQSQTLSYDQFKTSTSGYE